MNRAILMTLLAAACLHWLFGGRLGDSHVGTVHAQSLQALRSEVRSEGAADSGPSRDDSDRRGDSSSRDDPNRSKRDGSSSFDDEEDDSVESLTAALFEPAIIATLDLSFRGLTSPFWGPQRAIGDQFGTIAQFPTHPYAMSPDVYLAIDPEEEAGGLRYWSARLRGEYGDNFDELSRMGGQFHFETTTRFGFDASSEYLRETRGPDQYDDLWLGDANFLFRFAQSEQAAFYAGLGMNWLSDRFASDLGFNFTYKVDLFPRRPWVASLELDFGTLGDETYIHARGTGGVMWRGIETYAGYDWTDVGSYDAGLFIAGVRLWF